jgi:2-polyprenyl-3-methyl-5-hydroxy-6-metoxy-1,4-benzoquinol methylase
MHAVEAVRADFDRIATVSGGGWSHNSHYHRFLLEHIPERCDAALDIGCGTGTFARMLAARADYVLAVDLSPEMIRLAGEQSAQYPNIEYRVADALAYDLPGESFDCVVSIATLHHLPMEEMLLKIRKTLKPGGTLVVLDLFRQEGVRDLLASGVAVGVNLVLRLLHTGRLREPREVRAAWAEHGQRDSYLTCSEVREICDDVLPAAKVRKHLLWRYSLVWQKPGARQP